MIELLEPLADLPGVRLAVLMTPDGVPIAMPGRRPGQVETEEESDDVDETSHVLREDSQLDPDALSALTMGWIAEITRAVGPLSWDAPHRVVLRATRGTVVLRRTHNAWLLVLLAGRLHSEDVILSMEGTAARIERQVRSMGSGESDTTQSTRTTTAGEATPAPLPSAAPESEAGDPAGSSPADLHHPRG